MLSAPSELAMAAFLARSSRLAAAGRAARAMSGPHPAAPEPAPACGSGCVPCKHKAGPPCRADQLPARTARIHVCCPPAPGSRPPCPPPQGSVTYTCASPVRRPVRTWCVDVPADDGPCGAEQDRVARRLNAARALRRASYEHDAALPPALTAPPCPPHCLPPAAHRLTASDGREYRAACPPPPAPRCQQGCPPDPVPVRLAHEDCPLYPIGAPDPCEHQPRDVLTVDRSARRGPPPCAGSPAACDAACAPAEPPAAAAPAARKACDAGLTSRIMRSLSIGRDERHAVTRHGGGKHGGGQPGGGPPARRFHSFTALAASGAPDAAAGQLEAALREREGLLEAGRGRVTTAGGRAAGGALPRGRSAALSLPLEDGGAVQVLLLVEDARPAAAAPAARGPSAPACGSWLRGLQKKLTPPPKQDEASCPKRERPKRKHAPVEGPKPGCGVC